MDNTFLKSDWSIYLDTSFILHTCYRCIDHKETKVKDAEKKLGDLLCYKQWNCYISNIVMSEIYTVIERTALQEHIDKKIISAEWDNIEKWAGFNTHTRQQLRFKYRSTEWFNIKVKDWRTNPNYREEYRIKVINEIKNIMDSLPDCICVNSIWDTSKTVARFRTTKMKYIELDWSDINHYLICKENNIDSIIACDIDFSSIDDKALRVFVI
jgi:predicted nucleic acid-binding protein